MIGENVRTHGVKITGKWIYEWKKWISILLPIAPRNTPPRFLSSEGLDILDLSMLK